MTKAVEVAGKSNAVLLFEKTATNLGLELPPEETDDTDEIAWQMASGILEKETAEDILAASTGNVLHGEDLAGKPFMLYSFEIRRSDKDKNGVLPYYLLCTIDRGRGNELMSVGALTVVMQSVALAKRGLLPQRVKIVQSSKPTASGYYPLQLVLTDDTIETQSTLLDENGEPF